MYRQIQKLSHSTLHEYNGRHRYEHWFIDNQVYFITSTCRDHFRAFASEQAKAIFWDRFDHYCEEFHFVPWVTSLLDNHYHTLGYIKNGRNIGKLMQRLHGSVAKGQRHSPATTFKFLARCTRKGILRWMHP
jgi:REP element-mobilizing transposase RayT